MTATTAGPSVIESTDPRNLDAERGILTALLRENNLYETVADTGLTEAHFYKPEHRAAYVAIIARLEEGRPAHPFVMTNEIDGPLLKELNDARTTVTPRDVREWAEDVIEQAAWLLVAKVGRELQQDAVSAQWGMKPADIIAAAESKLFSLVPENEKDGLFTHNQAIDSLTQQVMENQKPENQKNRVVTGLVDLDRRMGRLRPKTLAVVGGRVSQGKTVLAMTIARHNAREGRRGIFFSLEMSKEELASRNIASLSGISVQEQDNILSDTQMRKFMNARNQLAQENWPLEIVDTPRLKLSQIRRIARRHKRKHGLDFIVIDYLQIMGDDIKVRDAGSRTYQIAHNTGGLKALAKELDIPIVVLSQVGRGVEDSDDHRPGMSDLSDSSAIEKDADTVMFIHRPEYYLAKKTPIKTDKETIEKFNARQIEHAEMLRAAKGKAEIIVVKARQSDPPFTIPVAWDGARALLSNLAQDY